jgi:hypothetical protein
MHHKVRLGKVQCAPARSLCEIRPKPIEESGLNPKTAAKGWKRWRGAGFPLKAI